MRHIFIGDIHGCFDELQRLLDSLAPDAGDVVVSVGDIVGKGPAVSQCLELWRDRRYCAVLGNHEEKDGGFDWPLFVDFPSLGVAVVHGGVLPETRFDAEAPHASTTLRFLRLLDGQWRAVPKGHERPGDRFWSEVWDGDRTVVYGHTPRKQIQRDAKAIGLDTSCVYGGSLSAAILENGQWSFVSVPAARKYARRPLLSRLRRYWAL